MDALVSSYGESSSSDSDSSPPRTTGSNRNSVQEEHSNRLPPPPVDLLTPPNSLDGLKSGGSRVRSFPHVEGNYAVHVSIPGTEVDYEDLVLASHNSNSEERAKAMGKLPTAEAEIPFAPAPSKIRGKSARNRVSEADKAAAEKNAKGKSVGGNSSKSVKKAFGSKVAASGGKSVAKRKAAEITSEPEVSPGGPSRKKTKKDVGRGPLKAKGKKVAVGEHPHGCWMWDEPEFALDADLEEDQDRLNRLIAEIGSGSYYYDPTVPGDPNGSSGRVAAIGHGIIDRIAEPEGYTAYPDIYQTFGNAGYHLMKAVTALSVARGIGDQGEKDTLKVKKMEEELKKLREEAEANKVLLEEAEAAKDAKAALEAEVASLKKKLKSQKEKRKNEKSVRDAERKGIKHLTLEQRKAVVAEYQGSGVGKAETIRLARRYFLQGQLHMARCQAGEEDELHHDQTVRRLRTPIFAQQAIAGASYVPYSEGQISQKRMKQSNFNNPPLVEGNISEAAAMYRQELDAESEVKVAAATALEKQIFDAIEIPLREVEERALKAKEARRVEKARKHAEDAKRLAKLEWRILMWERNKRERKQGRFSGQSALCSVRT